MKFFPTVWVQISSLRLTSFMNVGTYLNSVFSFLIGKNRDDNNSFCLTGLLYGLNKCTHVVHLELWLAITRVSYFLLTFLFTLERKGTMSLLCKIPRWKQEISCIIPNIVLWSIKRIRRCVINIQVVQWILRFHSDGLCFFIFLNFIKDFL